MNIAELQVWGLPKPIPCDYPRAALRCMILAGRAYAEGRTDMDSRDMGEIATVYGIPWEAMGIELQGDFYSWWFSGIGKAEK